MNNDNVVDEFTLGQLIDQGTALSILENHWQTVRYIYLSKDKIKNLDVLHA